MVTLIRFWLCKSNFNYFAPIKTLLNSVIKSISIIKIGFIYKSVFHFNNNNEERYLIEHKEAIVVCEESGPISLNYNALLTTPHANQPP